MSAQGFEDWNHIPPGTPTHVLTYVGPGMPSAAYPSDDEWSHASGHETIASNRTTAGSVSNDTLDDDDFERIPEVREGTPERVASWADSLDLHCGDDESHVTLSRSEQEQEQGTTINANFTGEACLPSRERFELPGSTSNTSALLPRDAQTYFPSCSPLQGVRERQCRQPPGRCAACTARAPPPMESLEEGENLYSYIPPEPTTVQEPSSSPPPTPQADATTTPSHEIYRGIRAEERTGTKPHPFPVFENMIFETPVAPLNTLRMRSNEGLVRLGFDGADKLRVFTGGDLKLSILVDASTRLEVEHLQRTRPRWSHPPQLTRGVAGDGAAKIASYSHVKRDSG